MKRRFHSASIQKRNGTQILPRAQNVPLLVKSQLVHPLLARLSSNIEYSFNNSGESTHILYRMSPPGDRMTSKVFNSLSVSLCVQKHTFCKWYQLMENGLKNERLSSGRQV